MAPSSKSTPAKDRRKSSASTASAASKVITLKVSPDRLRAVLDPAASDAAKEDTPMKDSNDSPSTSTPVPNGAAAIPDNASDSNPATPGNGGTPAPSVMGPPGDGQGPKKKGVKRSAAATNGDAPPKVRGKPGPKRRKVKYVTVQQLTEIYKQNANLSPSQRRRHHRASSCRPPTRPQGQPGRYQRRPARPRPQRQALPQVDQGQLPAQDLHRRAVADQPMDRSAQAQAVRRVHLRERRTHLDPGLRRRQQQ